MKKFKYAVAMSGGVDSSTTAALLKAQGHEVFGITMDTYTELQDSIEQAREICKILKIDHYVLQAHDEFKRCVIDVFAEYYANGMTPNPCALCNRDIKMNLLLKFAKEQGADLMATGHYVNLTVDSGVVMMYEAKNAKKDQSYFLSLVKKENLECVRFPLGDIEDKNETRELANSFGLPNFDKKDSQDICFIKDGNYKKFLSEFYSDLNLFSEGSVRLKYGDKILAKHNGIANYTVGQRRGLGIAHNAPLYVIELNAENNEVIVGTEDDLDIRQFSIFSMNWIIEMPQSFEAWVKLRSLSKKTKAMIHKTASGANVELLEKSATPVTAGQICAIYNAQSVVVGGGIISKGFGFS